MPLPPYSSSTVIPSSPSCPSSGHRSRGNLLVRSISSARGAIRSAVKLCTLSRRASTCSPRPKSKPRQALAIMTPLSLPVARVIDGAGRSVSARRGGRGACRDCCNDRPVADLRRPARPRAGRARQGGRLQDRCAGNQPRSCPRSGGDASGRPQAVRRHASAEPSGARAHLRRRAWPGTTPSVLDALRSECVKATFFVLGRNAADHPDILRRELAEGHTVAHHTWSHRLLSRIPIGAAEAEIDRGIAAVDGLLYGKHEPQPATPFFRFPGFASSPALLARRGIIVFGADLWASDWNAMRPDAELHLVLRRLEQARGGIVLFHDTKRQTAAMLPAFLRALKARGFRIVHVVPRQPAAQSGRLSEATKPTG